ncbi:MAG: hypothetical protein JW861_08860 [Bacteroidales bacterium]|nr:hypothetical protein [Bacteroidales bacterium]
MTSKEQRIIETVGSIAKRETLASIEEVFTGGILVLENLYPFPGYYHDTIPDKKDLNPGVLFLITRQKYSGERILRINHEVKKHFRKKFDGAPAQLTLFNEQAHAVRIKFLEDYNDLPELIVYYQDHGLQFHKYRKVEPYESIIKVKKYFLLEHLGSGIYRDGEQPEICYIQIPSNLKWNTFEKITIDLKRNLEDNKFDAALGTIFRMNCVVDVVRIYDRNTTHEKIGLIRSRYLEEINKLRSK